MIPREAIIETARRVYRSYGFSPIDTPALEHLEILTGKGSEETDKQMYRFEDHGGRAVGMRFDLTVPLARFVAQHIQELGTPFKRYQIANVWRGENTQRGRYREFMQCDFDTIGTTSTTSDIETLLVINDLFEALGFERFSMRGTTKPKPAGSSPSWALLTASDTTTELAYSISPNIRPSACEAPAVRRDATGAGVAMITASNVSGYGCDAIVSCHLFGPPDSTRLIRVRSRMLADGILLASDRIKYSMPSLGAMNFP